MINYYVFLYGSGCSYSDHTTIINRGYSDHTTIPYKKMGKYIFI